MTATEAARSFSDLLNRVAAGEEKSRLLSAERFRELVTSAPPTDPGFVDDVRAARTSIGPPEDAWPS